MWSLDITVILILCYVFESSGSPYRHVIKFGRLTLISFQSNVWGAEPAPSSPMRNSYSPESTQQRTFRSMCVCVCMYYYYYYYYHHHHITWVQFQKGKKQTTKQTKPHQVFSLKITLRIITIVNCVHTKDISKININQYEFFSQPNQKTK